MLIQRGLKDIEKKILRPPEQSEEDRSIIDIYKEDPLRILRLIRFHDKTGGWDISDEVINVLKDFIKNNREYIFKKLSRERIGEEFLKIIKGQNPAKSMEMMKNLGLLWIISPELEKMLDIYHDTVFHSGESVWEHTMDVLSKTPATKKARLAALFHDIGKIGTKPDIQDTTGEKRVPVMTTKTDSEGRERVQFIGHEIESGRMIRKILSDLRMENIADSVAEIAKSHMGFKKWEELKEKSFLRKARIFIERLYNDLNDAISLLKADEGMNQRTKELESRLHRLKQEDISNGILRERGGKIEYVVPLNYKKVMEEYSELKGELIGMVNSKLRKALMEGRIKNEAEAKKELDSIMRQSKQFEQLLRKYRKEKKSPDFYKIT